MPILKHTKKHLGQHWLHEKGVIEKCIQVIQPQSVDCICEIGVGLCALTIHLAPIAQTLHLIEIDQSLLEDIQRILQPWWAKIHLYCQDVLCFSWDEMPPNLRIVGNLPYNIASQILFALIEISFIDAHFLLQKEVVERLIAPPHSADYTSFSVTMQAFFQIKKLFYVHPGSFSPPPGVISTFFELKPSQTRHMIKNEDYFRTIVKKAFKHRRKTLANNLKEELWILKALAISPQCRPHQLSPIDYIHISNMTN